MTAQEALQLSVAHNLGSARNTLVPGVEVPAFVDGMDPDQWKARVTAIGLSKLAPAGWATSQWKYENVPGSFDIGSSAPGSSKIMIPKSEQEKSAAIELLMKTLLPAGGGEDSSGGDQFANGRWVFGNDLGGLQSATLSQAQLQESIRQASVREAQQAQQLAAQQRQAEESRAIQRQQLGQQAGQTQLNTILQLIDRQNQAGQAQFANELNLAQMGGASSAAAIGSQSIDQSLDAGRQMDEAIQTYNRRLAELATTMGVPFEPGRDGVNKLKTDKGNSLDASTIYATLDSTGMTEMLTKARQAMDQAEATKARAAYAPRTSGALPAIPQMNPALLDLLQRFGLPTQATTTTAPQRTVTAPAPRLSAQPKIGQSFKVNGITVKRTR